MSDPGWGFRSDQHLLHWCRECMRHTYWRGERCQLCQQHRVALTRNIIIAIVCIVAFVASCTRIWMGL